jgi:hypothetical protein
MPEIYTDNESFRHSSEVNEIITRVPSWILRWGLTVFFIVLIGIIGFSALIDYPDIIRTTLKIKTNYPDKKIVCDAPADIVQILVEPGDQVKTGQVLAYLKYDDSTIHALRSSVNGKLFYNGIVRSGQAVSKNSEIFYIEPGRRDFYGEMSIPQRGTEINKGQVVLIKLKNYPFEQYGILKGTIKYTSEIDGKDIFIAEVEIKKAITDKSFLIQLKPGMDADAEIIIKSTSALQSILNGLFKF